MGTAVLSPQDCFVSPHGRHDYRFNDMIHYRNPSTPKSRRAVLQAAVMQSGIPSFATEVKESRPSRAARINLAEINMLNNSPGLLPVPDACHEARHSSLTRPACSSAPVRKHIISSIPSRPRHTAGSPATTSPSSHRASSIVPSASSKSSFSRSASAGLFASCGSQKSAVGELSQENPNLSDAGFVSKVSRTNRMGGHAADKFESGVPVRRRDAQSSKFVDVQKGFNEKPMFGCGSVGDLRKRTRADFVCHQAHGDGDGPALSRNGWLEGVINGSQGSSEIGKRRETVRGFSETEKDTVGPPVITILQRPKDKDAAVELISRFFKEVESASMEKSVDEESGVEEIKCDNRTQLEAKAVSNERTKMNVLKEAARSDCSNGALEFRRVPVPSVQRSICEDRSTQTRDSFVGVALPKQGSMDSHIFSHNHQVEMMDICGHETVIDDVGAREISDYFLVFGGDKWAPIFDNERWAGPAFTNSPPPSSLPLPNFPVKQFRMTHRSNTSVGNLSVTDSLHHSPPGAPFVSIVPSTRRSVSLNGCSPISLRDGACDVAFATKDLRRLLNLDAC